MAEDKENKKSIQDVLNIVTRHMGLFLVTAAAAAVILMFVGRIWPPLKYEGNVTFQRKKTAVGEKIQKMKSGSFESTRETLIQELTGQIAVRRAVEELGLVKTDKETGRFPRTPDGTLTKEGEIQRRALVEGIRERLSVKIPIESATVDVVVVNYVDGNPNRAFRIPNKLVQDYIAKIREEVKRELTTSRDFLKDKVDECQRRYDTACKERLDFLKNPENLGMMLDTPSGLEQMTRNLENGIRTAERQQDEAKIELAQLESMEQAMTQPAGEPGVQSASRPAGQPTVEADSQAFAQTATKPAEALPRIPARVLEVEKPNPERRDLEKDLSDAKDELIRMTRVLGMKEQHPAVEMQQRRIAQLEKRIEETPDVVFEKTYVYEKPQVKTDTQPALQTSTREDMTAAQIVVRKAALRATIAAVGRDINRMEAQLGECHSLLERVSPVRVDYEKLVSVQKAREKELEGWQVAFNEVQRVLETEVKDQQMFIEALQLAQEPVRPSSPTFTKILAFALFGGLAVGAGLVFLAHTLDHSIVTTDDASKAFDVPVHGAIGEIATPVQRVRRSLRRWIVGTTLSIVLLCVMTVAGLFLVGRLDPQMHKTLREKVPGQFAQSLFDLTASPGTQPVMPTEVGPPAGSTSQTATKTTSETTTQTATDTGAQ